MTRRHREPLDDAIARVASALTATGPAPELRRRVESRVAATPSRAAWPVRLAQAAALGAAAGLLAVLLWPGVAPQAPGPLPLVALPARGPAATGAVPLRASVDADGPRRSTRAPFAARGRGAVTRAIAPLDPSRSLPALMPPVDVTPAAIELAWIEDASAIGPAPLALAPLNVAPGAVMSWKE